MQKIILDTNVVVSALISNSFPTFILYDLVLTRKVYICLSDSVLSEYIGVLKRDKFDRFRDFRPKADVVINKMREISLFYSNTPKVELLIDASDDKFLELAIASAADYLITGNTSDFKIPQFENTIIITPREYWDNYKPIHTG